MFYNKNEISQIECIENELLLLRDEAQIASMLSVWNSNKNNEFIKIIKMKNIDNGITIHENKNDTYVNQVSTDVTNQILGTNVESQSIVYRPKNQ